MKIKRIFSWQLALGLSLIALSAAVYLIHYVIFQDAHHIFIYLLGDIAFVFIEVLMVTMIIHRLLSFREKRSRLKKMNMAIGTFFNEVGTDLLELCAGFDPDVEGLTQKLILTKDCTEKEFSEIRKFLKKYPFHIEHQRGDLNALKKFLYEKRNFLLNLLGNPNLLEHEKFTDLLWAVFHLTDELIHRKNLKALPDSDYLHLSGDIKRAYRLLMTQWLVYMKHLKKTYPYLFSIAMRTNPFDKNVSIEVA